MNEVARRENQGINRRIGIDSSNRMDCSGCGSCAAVCPKNCITMVADAEGFLYPEVDITRCVNCGRCQKVCPVQARPAVHGQTTALAAQNANLQIRQQSSSGGVFTALAERILADGGSVCGAVYDSDFSVHHIIANTSSEIAKMRGAKYAQSYAGHLYPRLKQLLEEDKPVLFVGTPCQCAGLKAFLGCEYENLLFVDMVCHGAASPFVWQRYLKRRKALDACGAELRAVNVREKSTGWSRYAYSVRFEYDNGACYSILQGKDPFMMGFVGNLYLRPSCSRCAFKGLERCADLTLGDCWGIWDSHPEFDDDKGTSLLLIHSPKGNAAWKDIASDFSFIDLDTDEALAQNPSALVSSPSHPKRAEFFAQLANQTAVDALIMDCIFPKPGKRSFIKRLVGRLRGWTKV